MKMKMKKIIVQTNTFPEKQKSEKSERLYLIIFNKTNCLLINIFPIQLIAWYLFPFFYITGTLLHIIHFSHSFMRRANNTQENGRGIGIMFMYIYVGLVSYRHFICILMTADGVRSHCVCVNGGLWRYAQRKHNIKYAIPLNGII